MSSIALIGGMGIFVMPYNLTSFYTNKKLNFFLINVLLFILSFNQIYADNAYKMKIESIDMVNNSTVTLSIYIENLGEELELTSYQCALSINQNIDLPSLSLTYVEGSSELINEPDLYVGIKNIDGPAELTFVSRVGNDIISSKTCVGAFTLEGNIDINNIDLLDIQWDFEGTISTIITGKDFANITNPSSHEINSPLPVELTTFSASVVNKNVEINWQTATEVNNYGFDVERIKATQIASNNWKKIGFVQGHGNSNSPKFYFYMDNSNSLSGTYLYRLKQIDIDGSFEYSDIVELIIEAPSKVEMNQNYPNPFNPTTIISYSIPEDGHVSLMIYDVLGNEVANLENGHKSAGNYSNTFEASNLTSGIYFYTIITGKFVETKKMLLMK